MRDLEFSERAIRDLKTFDATDRTMIFKKLDYLAENYEALKTGKSIRELVNSPFGRAYRFTINRKIRAVFKEEEGRLVLMILRVGLRKSIYE